MSEWTVTTLGAIATVITGPFGSQLHKSDYVNTGIASIMPQNIKNRTVNFDSIAYVSEQDSERLKRYKIQENDIVYSRRGDVEKHAFISKDLAGALCGTGCLRVRFISNEVYPEFISLFLDRPETKKWIRQNAVGSSMPNLNSDILSEVPIRYPKKEVQIALSTILVKIEQKIRLNNRIIAELEAMAKTIYDYWFVQFDFPNAEGMPYRSSGGEMVYNEQLKREIPKGWSAKKIKNVCTLESGYPFSSETYCHHGKYKLITIKNVQDSGLNLNVDNCIDELPINLPDYCRLRQSDILMSLTGNVGRIGLMFDDNCLLNQRVAVVRLVDERLRGFVFSLFKNNLIRAKLETLATGSSQDNLSPIEAVELVIPYCESVILNYSKNMSDIIDLMVKNMQEIMGLTTLRDFLLPLLMNGQVTVATDET